MKKIKGVKRVKKPSTKHPDKNLGRHLFEKSGLVSANVTKVGPAKKIGNVAAVAKAIKSNKRKPGYV